MTIQIITAPTVEPVTVARAKLHLRVDIAADDELIAMMITSARQSCETMMQRSILPQTLELALDAFPGADGPGELRRFRALAAAGRARAFDAIALPRGPVSSVTSVKYTDTAGAEQTLAGAAWQTDLRDDRVGYVLPVYGGSWPTTRDDINAVRVRYVAGWADPDSVPAPVVSWILLRIGGLYENREQFVAGVEIKTAPFVDRLLDPWAIPAI